MTNNVHFVPQYCYACSKAVRAHSVFVVRPGMSECIIKVRRYNVNSVLCADPQKFWLIGAALVGEIWGWFIRTAFVFVVEVPVYVCSSSAWWVAGVSSRCWCHRSEH